MRMKLNLIKCQIKKLEFNLKKIKFHRTNKVVYLFLVGKICTCNRYRWPTKLSWIWNVEP